MAVASENATVAPLNSDQRLSLQCEEISTDTSTIRCLDWDRSRFDIEFGLRNGTTYNSYLIRGAKTALVDTSHLKFKDTWLQLLKQQIEPTAIDYLIVSHTEPDHSGLVGEIIDLNPEIEILASKVALQFLQDQGEMEGEGWILSEINTDLIFGTDNANKWLKAINNSFIRL